MQEAFQRILRRERTRRALSQQDVAEQVGTTAVNISRWERGSNTPTPYFRRKLCELFEMRLEELFPEDASSGENGTPLLPSEKPPAGSHLFLADPIFFYNTTLPHVGEFFGRTREWRMLLARTSTGQPTAIVGPRRIGKSWLLRYLCLKIPQLLDKPVHIAALDVSWPSCSTLSGVFAFILREFHLPEPPDKRVHSYLQALEMGVKELRAHEHLPLLCIDKFDRMYHMSEMTPDILDRLRAMTQIGLGLVITSSKPLDMLTHDAFDLTDTTSPFTNVFLQLRLKPFTAQEAQHFVRVKGAQAGFTDEECGYLLTYGRREKNVQSWPPLRLQLVGTLLLTDKVSAQEDGVSEFYRPHDPAYWAEFEQQVEAEMQEME